MRACFRTSTRRHMPGALALMHENAQRRHAWGSPGCALPPRLCEHVSMHAHQGCGAQRARGSFRKVQRAHAVCLLCALE